VSDAAPTYLDPDDDASWGLAPDFLRHVVDVHRERGGRMAYHLLGDIDDDPPTALVLELAPGQVINRHAHGCERMEVIVRGSLLVGERVFGPGTVMRARSHELYGPHVAGPDGCTTVEFFSRLADAYRPIYETDAGRVVVDASRIGFQDDPARGPGSR
jgi:hypothetical protein